MSSPLLSIFTPTHDPKHLLEAYSSLKVQNYDNFEWIIVPNGGTALAIPEAIVKDKRVRVIANPPGTDKIGALKLFACDQCQGDAFIEFDHDDLLVPGTLQKVAAAVEKGAGFVYSDVAVFNDGTLRGWAYHPSHGWESYDLRVYNRPFKATRCFDLTPRSLCEVYYAPDHVRCWSRKAYYKAGGHNPTLAVGDDHDLVCRTYLTGVPFVHIGGCGYLYRYHQGNTVKKKGGDIQTQQNINRRRYLVALVNEWCRRNEYEQIDLLALYKQGKWTPESYITGDNKYGQVSAVDVLQFVPPHLQVPTINRLYEVLIPGGFLNVAVPSCNGRYAIQDPRHLTQFNHNSFLYYSNKAFAKNNPDIQCRFQLVQQYDFYPNDDFKRYDMKLLQVDLCALKGQRQPGVQEI